MKFYLILSSVFLLVGCGGNKDLAVQIMADLKTDPPIKSMSVTKAGTTKTEYHDTTQVLLNLTSLLMVNETLEWAKVFTPVVTTLGTNWVSNYYGEKKNAAMWKGIEGIAGDRYTVSSDSNIVQDSSWDVSSGEVGEIEEIVAE